MPDCHNGTLERQGGMGHSTWVSSSLSGASLTHAARCSLASWRHGALWDVHAARSKAMLAAPPAR